MDCEQIKIEREENIAIVTIDRHEKRNVLGAATIAELERALDELEDDAAVKALVVAGAGGKAFCAGAELEGGFDLGGDVEEFVRAGQQLFERIEKFPKPVVAAVEGYAFGGGCELMLSCDLVIAADNAPIGMPEVGLGLMPGWRGTQMIPRIAGKQAAMELMLGGGRIRAPRAYELGLVNKVVPKEQVMAEAKETAKRLGRQPEHSVRLIKEAVTLGLDMPVEDGLRLEAENFAEAFKVSGMAEKLKK